MLNIIINLLTQGGPQAQSTLQGVATAANNVGSASNSAAGGLNNTSTSLNNTTSAAGSTTTSLNDVLNVSRNVGAGFAVAGTAGLAFANSLIEIAEGGNAMEARLESILNAQKRVADLDLINEGINDITIKGHFDDDDDLRDATVKMASFSVETQHMKEMLEDAARQARTMGTDVSSVAEQLAKAYNTGNVAALKKSGVTMSAEDVNTIKEAYKMSQELGQAKFMELVTPAIVNNTVELADSLTAATAASNDFARGIDDLQTNVGTGAAEAKRAITEGILAPILAVIGASPEMQKSGGWLLYIGSTAATAGGSLIALGSQVGLTMLAFPALGTTAATAFATVKAAAASTIPFLGAVASALAVPLGILAAGIAVGMAGYELLRRAGVLGKDAPDAITAAKNVVANVKDALGIGAGPAVEVPKDTAPIVPAPTPPALPMSTRAASDLEDESEDAATAATVAATPAIDKAITESVRKKVEKHAKAIKDSSESSESTKEVSSTRKAVSTSAPQADPLALAINALMRGASLDDLEKSGKAGSSTQKPKNAGPLTVDIPLRTTQEPQGDGTILIRMFGEARVDDAFKRAMRGVRR